jgi:hypothetical protein
MARKKDFIRPTNPAGALYATYAMNTMRNAGIGANEMRTDVRYIGDTLVTMRRNQSSPPHVEATAPTTKLELKTCPKGDYGFLDLATFGASAVEGPTSGTESLNATHDETGAVKQNKYLKNTMDQKTFFRAYLPSLYTGGMRRVMQVIHGMGAVEVRKRPDLWDAENQRLRIQPGYYVTHGVFIGSNKKRWIIEIGYAGIFRIPVEFCSKLPTNWRAEHAEIEAEGWPNAHKKLARYWTPVQIDWGGYEQIGDVPVYYTNGETPLYGTCGWAFDSDGHNAVNIGARIDPDDPVNARRRATLYMVTISEDGEGNPGHATCTETEHGELVNRYDDTDANKGPAIIQVASTLRTVEGLHGYCTTFPCYPGLIGPRLFSTNTPVFAYYDPADALHVVRFTPVWTGGTTSSSTSFNDVKAQYADTFDVMTGDLSGSAAFYGNDSAWPYNSNGYSQGILGATWSSESRTEGQTMRFSSPGVSPVSQNYVESRSDSSLQTYGNSFLASGGSYSSVFVLIEWDVTHINLETGETNFNKDYRIASVDSSATTRVSVVGVISKTESNSTEKRNHQVLVLHGYDRTSYAVYSREVTIESDATITYGPTELAVPDTASLEYNGIYSSGWVSINNMSIFDSDTTTPGPPPTRIIRTTVGISKYPDMVTYNVFGNTSVSPPVGSSQPGSTSSNFDKSRAIVGGTSYNMDVTGTDMEDVYILSDFFYKAGGSFVPTRAFYQLRENMTPSKVTGVGSLVDAAAHVNGFVGYF